VEHAVAEEEGHGQPTARGLGQGHRPDGAALAGSRPDARTDTRTDTHPETRPETHTDPDTERGPEAARPGAAGRQLSGSRDRAVG